MFNAYDACVANRTRNNKQHTVRFHVDDILSLHVELQVNGEFTVWLQKTYREIKDVSTTLSGLCNVKRMDNTGWNGARNRMVVRCTKKGKSCLTLT